MHLFLFLFSVGSVNPWTTELNRTNRCLCDAVVGVVEVVKGMQELGVTPDVDTFHNYILPVFSSTDAARQALKVGVCVCVVIKCELKYLLSFLQLVFLERRCFFGVWGLCGFRGSEDGRH